MKRRYVAAWLLVLMLCIQGGGAAAAKDIIGISQMQYLLNTDSNAHEMPIEGSDSFILPSLSVWQPYAEGGDKHVLISASAPWRVEVCPEWVELYILKSDINPSSGMIEWVTEPIAINSSGEEVFYPVNANVFMRVSQNVSQADRSGVILLKLADGTSGKISVSQAQYVEALNIEIIKPCADAVDFIMAGYETPIEVKMSNALAGRVQIIDADGNVLHTANFSKEAYEFEFVFEPGCYVICAEATGEEEISAERSGYLCKKITITVSELEVIEEIGLTRNYVEYVKAREGKRNKPYRDIGGLWTIGYGHLIDETLAKKYASGWSDELCEEQLMYDLKFHADLMRERLGEELYSQLTPNQFDALVSLEFNGCGRAVGSSYRLGQCLLKLDEVEDWRVINGFATWHGINNGTIDVLGLYYRRMEEARIFLYGDYTIKFNWPQPWWLNIGSSGTGTSIHDVPSGSGWYKDIIPTLETSVSLIEAGERGTAEYITIRSGRAWSIEIDEAYPWITASSYRGSNGNIVEIAIAENSAEARHGVIKVHCGATVRTIHVHQKGMVPPEDSSS